MKNETEDGVSIAQKIKAVNCPLECSGNGKCLNGKIKKFSRTALLKGMIKNVKSVFVVFTLII